MRCGSSAIGRQRVVVEGILAIVLEYVVVLGMFASGLAKAFALHCVRFLNDLPRYPRVLLGLPLIPGNLRTGRIVPNRTVWRARC